MEALPPPPPPARKKLELHRGGLGRVLRAKVVAVAASSKDIVRVYADAESLSVIARAPGKTTLHLELSEGGTEDVDVVVVNGGDAPTRGIAIGESIVLPLPDVKDYSVGLPEIASASMTTDGTQLVVTGKKAGATTILLLGPKGNRSHELVVVDGRRLL